MALSKEQPLDLANNYVKSAEGLQACCLPAASVLERQLDDWHNKYNQQQDYLCTGVIPSSCPLQMPITCPSGKKPKPSTHCAGCVRWKDAIINDLAAIDPDTIEWQFGKPSMFADSSIAVAKLFGLRIVPGADLEKVRKFTDFDPAMVLVIMVRTNLFQGFPDIVNKLKAIRDYRHVVMHRPIIGQLNREELRKHQTAYENLIYSLRTHLPTLFNKRAQDECIKKLKEIRDIELVNPKMVVNALRIFMVEIRQLTRPIQDDIDKMKTSFQLLVTEVGDKFKKLDDLQADFTAIMSDVQKNREDVESCKSGLRCVSGDIEGIKEELKDQRMFKEAIDGNKEAIDGNKEAIDGNKEAIDGNKEAIDVLMEAVDAVKEDFDGVKKVVEGIKKLIIGKKEGLKCSSPKDIVATLTNTQMYNPHQRLISMDCDAQKRLMSNYKEAGLECHGNIPRDGNCFFHAISDQLALVGVRPFLTADQLRKSVVDYLRNNPIVQGPNGVIDFKQYMESAHSDFEAYLNYMAQDGTWADGLIVFAMAHMLHRHFVIVTSSPQGRGDQPICWVIADNKYGDKRPLLLGHIWENHYISLQMSKEPIPNKNKNLATELEQAESLVKSNPLTSSNCKADGLNLRCNYWTEDTVYLKWEKKSTMIETGPYKLCYQEDNGPMTELVLHDNDNYFTSDSLELPGNYRDGVLLRSGMRYTFYLNAELEGGEVLNDSVQITMADGPCMDTLNDLLNNQDILRKVYKLMDVKRTVYRKIAIDCGLELSEVDHLKQYATLDNPITVLVFQACIEKCMELTNESALKICNILRSLHEHNGTSRILRIIFDWHTGRKPCSVCTRKQFLGQ